MQAIKPVLVLSDPDADSVTGAWTFCKKHGLWFEKVDFDFVRSGQRMPKEKYSDRKVIHIDTGLIFDGLENFDHHQDDSRVKAECATSLIHQSFPPGAGSDPVLDTIVEFVRNVDHSRGREGIELIYGLQFAPLLRGFSSLLQSLETIKSNIERVRAGFYVLDGFYEGTWRTLRFADEIRESPRIKLVKTDFGTVFFGETEKGHRELRSFVMANLRKKPDVNVEVIIASYRDNSVGVTLLGREEEWKVSLKRLSRFIREEFPTPEIFLHGNGFMLYIYPVGGDKNTVPTIDRLFDLTHRAYNEGRK